MRVDPHAHLFPIYHAPSLVALASTGKASPPYAYDLLNALPHLNLPEHIRCALRPDMLYIDLLTLIQETPLTGIFACLNVPRRIYETASKYTVSFTFDMHKAWIYAPDIFSAAGHLELYAAQCHAKDRDQCLARLNADNLHPLHQVNAK